MVIGVKKEKIFVGNIKMKKKETIDNILNKIAKHGFFSVNSEFVKVIKKILEEEL